MVNPAVIEEKPVSMAELKTELKKIKKRDGELNYRANKTEEYVNQFVDIDLKKTKEISKEIEKLDIPRIKDIHIKKIIDMMPKTVEDVKSAIEAYPITINNDNLKKIASVIGKFA